MKGIISSLFLLSILLDFRIGNAQDAAFTDHGFIPVEDVYASIGYAAEFQAACYTSGYVFVATSDGVWKNNISNKEWSAAGLQGKKVACLVKHPAIEGMLYAGTHVGPLGNGNKVALYISTDAGKNWIPADTSVHETISCIAFNPINASYMYANVSGPDIIFSSDGGNTWSTPIGLFGYTSNIMFLPGNDSVLFQGSESPLDCAWLGQYKISEDHSVDVSSFQIVADGNCGTGPWQNRRPTNLSGYSYTGNSIYVGQEGALSKVNPDGLNQVNFIYYSEGQKDKPYSYIYGVWVDPVDTSHLIFGGALNGDNSGLMQLYETFDGGQNVFRYHQIFDISAPLISEIIEIESGKLGVLITDADSARVKLMIMEPKSLNVDDPVSFSILTLYPNPASDKVYLEYPSDFQGKDDLRVNVYSSDGRLLIRQKGGITMRSLSIRSLSSGIYQIQIETRDSVLVGKLVVKN